MEKLRSENLIGERAWADEDRLMMRMEFGGEDGTAERSFGRRRLVRRKGPRWLVANCDS